MTRLALALLLVGTAHADTIDVETGVGRTWVDGAETSAVVAASFGTDIKPKLHAGLHGRLVIGDATITTLGPELRCRHGRVFVAYGPAIARVLGPGPDDRRVRGIGLAGDLRAGVELGPITLAAHVLPIWVFANDSPTMALHSAVELGGAAGIRF